MSENSVFELDAGTDVTLMLSHEDMQACLNAIKEYDPSMAAMSKVIRSMDENSIVDVYLEDGSVWKLSAHPVGLSVDLLILGESHKKGPLTAAIACAYTPVIKKQRDRDFPVCVIPDVDCGDGYRQLEYAEEILETDEYYSGPKTQWAKTTCSGSQYRPRHCETHLGAYGLMRRKIEA